MLWLAVNLWKTPVDFFNVFLIGLTIGCVYALVALGYTLVYGILQLINFAHGDVFALSGLFATTIITSLLGLTAATSAIGIVGGLALTFLVAMVFGAGINAGIEFVAYRTAAQRAAAVGPDHRGRDVVHPPERRPGLLRPELHQRRTSSSRTRTSSTSEASTTSGTRCS